MYYSGFTNRKRVLDKSYDVQIDYLKHWGALMPALIDVLIALQY